MEFSENYQELRHICGVYALKKDKTIVYIGSSVDIYTRILEHKVDGIKDFDTVASVETFGNNEGATVARKIYEMGVICKLKPKHNKIFFTNFRLWMYSLPCEKIRKDIADIVFKEVDRLISKLEIGGHHGRA